MIEIIHPDVLNDEDSVDPLTPVKVRTNVSPDNPNVIIQGPFFRVCGDIRRVPLDDYYKYGCLSRREFYESTCCVIYKWGNREGECVEKCLYHGENFDTFDDRLTLLRLRFHDTPGCLPDEAWIPQYLADPIPIPEYAKWHTMTEYERNKKILTDFILYGKDDEKDPRKRF